MILRNSLFIVKNGILETAFISICYGSKIAKSLSIQHGTCSRYPAIRWEEDYLKSCIISICRWPRLHVMSNLKLNQMKNLIFIDKWFLFHIYRMIRDQSSAAAHVPCYHQVLVLMIHSQMKSMENRSENHLTLSMEKQVYTQCKTCSLVMKLFRIFQIRMIIWSAKYKMRCK